MIKSVVSFVLAFWVVTVVAAQGDLGDYNSPFSLFGLGNPNEQGYMHLRQMGGLHSSYYDEYHINFVNPATLAHLKSTSFDVGFTIENTRLSDGTNNSSQWNGNMSYIGIAFPLRNPLNDLFDNEDHPVNIGMGFNLSPVTTVSYDIARQDSLPGVGRHDRIYKGSGGVYKINWAGGIDYKNFSLGVSLGYFFGNTKSEQVINFIDVSNLRFNPGINRYEATRNNSYHQDRYSMKGFYADFGALYTLDLSDYDQEGKKLTSRSLILGLRYQPDLSFSTDYDEFIGVIGGYDPENPVDLVFADTTSSVSNQNGSGTLPGLIGLGATYKVNNQWALGLDYAYQMWSRYENEAQPANMTDGYRIGLGGYYRPDYKSINKFFNRVYYRFGLYYEKDPRTLNNDNITNRGIHIGMGWPFSWQRKISHLQLGLNIGQRSAGDLLTENYYGITLGFTFNDNEWFIKRKYN